MIVRRQISQRLTNNSYGVLTVSHDMANAFPSVDQDAIAVTVSYTVENFD